MEVLEPLPPPKPKGIRCNSRSVDPVRAASQESGNPPSFHAGACIEFFG